MVMDVGIYSLGVETALVALVRGLAKSGISIPDELNIQLK